jgi:uncharacterized protein YkwD
MKRRRIGILATALAALLAAGCGAESDSGLSSAEASAPALKATSDAGGHPLSAPTDDPGTLTFEAELLRLVNDHRVSMGLSALTDSPSLRSTARAHSQHMIVHRFFSHTSPEGLSPGDRLALNGIAWKGVGENIAAGYATPQAAFDAWLASPGHRANLESPEWTHAGVGYALDAAPSEEFPHAHLWTQNFVRQ